MSYLSPNLAYGYAAHHLKYYDRFPRLLFLGRQAGGLALAFAGRTPNILAITDDESEAARVTPLFKRPVTQIIRALPFEPDSLEDATYGQMFNVVISDAVFGQEGGFSRDVGMLRILQKITKHRGINIIHTQPIDYETCPRRTLALQHVASIYDDDWRRHLWEVGPEGYDTQTGQFGVELLAIMSKKVRN